jgi:hypothetical protein
MHHLHLSLGLRQTLIFTRRSRAIGFQDSLIWAIPDLSWGVGLDKVAFTWLFSVNAPLLQIKLTIDGRFYNKWKLK